MADQGLEKGRKLHGFANTPTGYQSQIKYKGEVLHISTCNTAAAAAKAFDRAKYKLQRTEKGLNFPLTPAEKAELDFQTVPEFLATVQLQKEQEKWLRIHGKSQFLGVKRAGGKWCAKGKRFSSEEEAAAEYDQHLIAKHGQTAMTNAKYFAGKRERKRAWEKLWVSLRKRCEEKYGVAHGKFKGVYCHDSGKGVYYPDTSYYGKVSVHGQEYLTALYYTPAEAAKGYDRLCYKLRGTQRGLNSPLSLEEKAELDGKSVAQHLASVHVDKEKWSWERRVKGPFLSSRGTLPYMGVSRNRNRWMGSYGKQGEPNYCARFFRREAEAACWYDMVVMEVQGYSAMTNAQFFSVARERGWKEREEVLARRIQQRMEATGERTTRGQLKKLSLEGIGNLDSTRERQGCQQASPQQLPAPSPVPHRALSLTPPSLQDRTTRSQPMNLTPQSRYSSNTVDTARQRDERVLPSQAPTHGSTMSLHWSRGNPGTSRATTAHFELRHTTLPATLQPISTKGSLQSSSHPVGPAVRCVWAPAVAVGLGWSDTPFPKVEAWCPRQKGTGGWALGLGASAQSSESLCRARAPTLPSSPARMTDCDPRAPVKTLHIAQGIASTLTDQHAETAATRPAFQAVTGIRALDMAWSPQPGGAGSRRGPQSPWAEALLPARWDLHGLRGLGRGASPDYVDAAWPSEAMNAAPSGWGQAAMRRVQLGTTALPRSKFFRLALPVTGGILCLLTACKQQHQ